MKAMIWRLAAHPKQALKGCLYTELSVGYIAKAAGVGWETARRAWHLVRAALPWLRVNASVASSLGVKLREKGEGTHWGQHLLLEPEQVSAAIRACEMAKLAEPHVDLPTGKEWIGIEPKSRGKYFVVSCPWHNDRHPSMVLYPNPGGASGSGVCMACMENGRRLTAYWRQVDGVFKIRKSVGSGSLIARVESKERSKDTRAMGTIHNQGERGSVLLWRRGSSTASSSSSSCESLVLALRASRAGTKAHQDALLGAAKSETHNRVSPRSFLPDLFISVDQMKVSSWKEVSKPGDRTKTIFIPDQWRPTLSTHLLVDLDGFEDAPITDSDLAEEGARLAKWAEKTADLSGEVAIVRTSYHGIQMVFGLANPQHPDWKRTEEAEKLHIKVERQAMKASKEAGFMGGHVDTTARLPGRLARRPGPRIDKHGLPYVSHLVFSRLEGEQIGS